MKKLLTAIGMACALAITANAQDAPKKPQLTDDQKAVKKEMLEKYDANKDGKLDKEERAKMTDADKDKWSKAFPRKPKNAGEGEKKDTATK